VSEEPPPSRRIAVATRGIGYAERVLVSLALREITPDVILLTRGPVGRTLTKRIRGLTRRRPREVWSSSLRHLLERTQGGEGLWASLGETSEDVGPLNGPRMLDVLRACRPDYLVLAGTGIVSAATLAIPRMGTLNVHPALLPWVPGVAGFERSLQRGIPLGVTAHFVDRGVDTGPVIHRELVPVTPRDTLASLKRKTDRLAEDVLIELVAEAARGGTLASAPQRERYPLCYPPSEREVKALAAAVDDGLALRLYAEWRSGYESRVLPAAE
jgi:hypothetical protein